MIPRAERHHDICVIIPAFNESLTIARLIEQLKNRTVDVVVVDDGSRDGTAEIVRRAGWVNLISHDRNKGKGVSLRDGFAFALKNGYAAVITMDADGQHHPDELDLFISAYRDTRAPFVIGNRMTDTARMPLIRVLTNRSMSSLISLITGQRIPDSQCGYRLISSDVLKRVHCIAKNYDIESEMLIRAGKLRFRISSVPVSSIYDQPRKSYINPLIDTIRFVKLLGKIAFGK